MSCSDVWRCVATVVTLGSLACHHPARDEPWPPPHLRVFPAADDQMELTFNAPALLAAGDSTQLDVARSHCHRDACFGNSESWRTGARWEVDRPEIASVSKLGRLVARRPGWVWVTMAKGDTVLRRHLEVMRPVASLTWEPRILHAFVGDTLWMRAIARDSAGREVRAIPGSGSRGCDVGSAFFGGGSLVPSGPGPCEVEAVLGARVAVAKFVVEARPNH